MIIAIRHFVGKTMNWRFAKKIRQEPAENAHRTPNWDGVPPQTAVERRRSHYERDQRGGAQEYSALEQSGVPKRDDLHGFVFALAKANCETVAYRPPNVVDGESITESITLKSGMR